MAFKTDKQRKAFFAKQGNPRSDTSPTMLEPQSKFQKLKGFIAKEKEMIRQKRESKGLARIEQEKIALEQEKATANRLRAELETEQARETVAMQRRETQAEFKKIEGKRFARSRTGRTISLGRRGISAGIKRYRKSSRVPARRRTVKRKVVRRKILGRRVLRERLIPYKRKIGGRTITTAKKVKVYVRVPIRRKKTVRYTRVRKKARRRETETLPFGIE